MRIALTGNPNSGKTTMYNALTGRNEKVGNWAGVTVEKKEASIKKIYCTADTQLVAVDLPGAYSMSPFTSEESITSSYVKKENPDVIINIVDATNLSRSLFFTTQLLELGIPVVVALNKSDINEKKETKIDSTKLSEKLRCPVVETTSTTADGLKEVVAKAVEVAGGTQSAPYIQGSIDLTSKESVTEADKKRFDFVNGIVRSVETRKVLTKDTSMFNLYTPPCFAAIGAMNSEMKSKKWLWAGIGLQLAVGYTVGYLVYTIGTLIANPASLSVVPAVAGGIAVAAMAAIVVGMIINTNKKIKAEYALA